MMYRYIGKTNIYENPYLQTNDVVDIKYTFVKDLNIVDIVYPDWIKRKYSDYSLFKNDWKKLNKYEIKSIEYYERKYKKMIVSKTKVNLKLFTGPLILINGNYYSIVGIDGKKIRDMVNGLSGFLVKKQMNEMASAINELKNKL